jgi:rhodanese-related sulfurtransferase
MLVIMGVSAAVAVGYVASKGLAWVPNVAALEAEHDRHEQLRATIGVDLQEFRRLIDHGAVVIDARSREAFAQGHLANACEPPVLNVPVEEIEEQVGRLIQLQGLPVVLYCASSTCDYAEELYTALREYGFEEIWIYFPVWEGILAAGLATEAGPDTWAGFDAEPFDEGDLYGDEQAADPNTLEEVAP